MKPQKFSLRIIDNQRQLQESPEQFYYIIQGFIRNCGMQN